MTGHQPHDEEELIALFPTLVWKAQLEPHAYGPINDAIRAKLDDMMARHPPLDYAQSFQTVQDLHRLPELAPLVELIQAAVGGVLDYLDAQCRTLVITGCWANVNAPGARHRAHTHPNNFLSGVYYVQTREGSDRIVFDDPRPQSFVVSPLAREVTLDNAAEIRMTVSDGTLILFPAWLQHRVDDNKSNENRISVAFNVMFSPEETFETDANDDQVVVIRSPGS
ncbi:MAG: TIGR02466 family protein [Gammaproteobacteria bacterium]|nr:TIGR02466 family protein [Gammaproteobacteria bacterium]